MLTHMPQNFATELVKIELPVGATITYAGVLAKPPKENKNQNYEIESRGWMVCEERSLKIEDYPELYSCLGNLYGAKDEEHFNLPDFRGMFLRGVGEQDLAPNSLEDRIKAENGEATGVGSTQNFALQTHIHKYTSPDVAQLPIGNLAKTSNATKPDQTSIPGESTKKIPGKVKLSPTETRPVNIFVYFLIKYTSHLPVFTMPA